MRDILSGKNANPKADLILDLSRALVCSTDYLLGRTEDVGAAPQSVGLDPRLLEALQRIPVSEHTTVRHMLEGVAEKSSYEFKSDQRRTTKPKKT